VCSIKPKTKNKKRTKSNMKNNKIVVGAAVAGLMLAAASSQAQFVLPTTSLAAYAGTSFLTSITPGYSALTSDGTLAGTVGSSVYSSGTGLDFVYQINETGNDSAGADELTVGGFSGVTILGVYDITGSGAVSEVGTFWKNASGTLEFLLNNNVTQGLSMDDIIVDTTATSFGVTTAGVIDSGGATTTALAPAAVPEASTVIAGMLMILPLGIGAFRAVRKERMA
jgi:hypothetical protein